MRVEESNALDTKIDTDDINDIIIDAIQDIKGKNIVKLDLRELDDASTDFFIICEGESTTQVGAIANSVKRKLREEIGLHVWHHEGERECTWVLLDYFDTVVHIFYPEKRAFYNIEDLWSDARVTEYENLY